MKIREVFVVLLVAVSLAGLAVAGSFGTVKPGKWVKDTVIDFGDDYMVVYRHEGTGEYKHNWFRRGEYGSQED